MTILRNYKIDHVNDFLVHYWLTEIFKFYLGRPDEGWRQRDEIGDKIGGTIGDKIDDKFSFANDTLSAKHCKNEYNFTNRAHYGSREQHENSILPSRYLETIQKDPKGIRLLTKRPFLYILGSFTLVRPLPVYFDENSTRFDHFKNGILKCDFLEV